MSTNKLHIKRYEMRKKRIALHIEHELNERVLHLSSKLCKSFGVTEEEFFGRGKSRHTVAARKLLYRILREAGYSYPEIARIACRNHSTIIHYLKKPVPKELKPILKQLRTLDEKWQKKFL